HARCGVQSGKEALAYMLGWRNIYFVFEKDVPLPESPSGSFMAILSPSLVRGSQPMLAVETGKKHLSLPLSGLERLVPQRIQVDRPVLSLPLNRSQRSIYLLVDGRRTVSDLARCTGRNILEVRQLLGELQQQGLVTF
ncbi:MAG: DUF4388 domain-containing protein, partial [Ktedonobacteraceae bacterium]|nr:DUF4388 domain-containing protein [Ktedonobacteraceae bacterium]